MAKELADLFRREVREGQDAQWGVVSSSNPLMVVLDSTGLEVGPLQYIRTRPSVGDKVLLLQAESSLVAVGRGAGFLGDLLITWGTSYTVNTFSGLQASGFRYKVRTDSIWGSTQVFGPDIDAFLVPTRSFLSAESPSSSGGFVQGAFITTDNELDQSFPNQSLSFPYRLSDGAYFVAGDRALGEPTHEIRLHKRSPGGVWSYVNPPGELGTWDLIGQTWVQSGDVLWGEIRNPVTPFPRYMSRVEYAGGALTITRDATQISTTTHPQLDYHDSDNGLLHGATTPAGGFFQLYAYNDVTFAVVYISPPIPCSASTVSVQVAGEGGSFFNLFHELTGGGAVGFEVWGVTASPTGYDIIVEDVPVELADWDLDTVFWNGGSVSLITSVFPSFEGRELTERLNPGEYSPRVVVPISDTDNPLGGMSSVTFLQVGRKVGPYANAHYIADVTQFSAVDNYYEEIIPV